MLRPYTIPHMTAQEIIDIIKQKFADKILAAHTDKHPRVEVDASTWSELADYLYHDPRLKLDWLANLTGMDYAAAGKLAVIYDLYSFDLKHTFAVKVFCNRETPTIPSVFNLWTIANWHEREAYDMFGIKFEGHPNLIRILCAEDWVGSPLRKDYVFPKEYKGIPADPAMPWDPTNKPKPVAAKPAAAKPAAPPPPAPPTPPATSA